jgi:hypothetical protein
MSRAKAIVVRSSRYPPTICTPIGKPLSVRPFGIVVAGSPFSVAMPVALRSVIVLEGRTRHRRTQHDIDLLEQVEPLAP